MDTSNSEKLQFVGLIENGLIVLHKFTGQNPFKEVLRVTSSRDLPPEGKKEFDRVKSYLDQANEKKSFFEKQFKELALSTGVKLEILRDGYSITADSGDILITFEIDDIKCFYNFIFV